MNSKLSAYPSGVFEGALAGPRLLAVRARSLSPDVITTTTNGESPVSSCVRRTASKK